MGYAAFDAIGFGALGYGKRWHFAGVIHDGSETLLWVVDDGVIFDELQLFFGESHRSKCASDGAACKRGAGRLNRCMVNPFAISWLWRGLKGNSVTFAVLFASLLLGWSVSKEVAHLLTRMGVHWLYVMILPAIFFMWLAKRENRFIPDESKRKLYARSLIIGSIVLAIAIAKLRD